MSNVIKAYAIRYNETKKREIDITERSEAVLKRQLGKVEAARLEASGGGFVEGFAGIETITENREAADVPAEPDVSQEDELREELTAQLQKELQTEAEAIIEKAKKEGEALLKRAASEAEALKVQLLGKAQEDGYAEGKKKAETELKNEKRRLQQTREELEEDYARQVSELEPVFAEVLIVLLQKLTGLYLEKKKEIITHLVSQAMQNCERSDLYLIKASKEDFDTLEREKQTLAGLFERPVQIEVVADPLLKKGECLIETDSRVIDCSLGTQLEGLLEDIRLLTLLE